MSTVRADAVRRHRVRLGFTLIELLVVIAIIALLAAILFPVFAKVREKTRQATAISNLHQIQTGLALYQLDYHKYPDVLFGYAVAGKKMSDQDGATGGLFPKYVNNYKAFTDPNNAVTDPSVTVPNVPVLSLDNTGKLTTQKQTFYKADAFDISPQVTGTNTVSSNLVTRYSPSWTNIDATLATATCAAGNTATVCNNQSNFYTKQMRWRSQPGDTYVTCSTYHVANANLVIVLFSEGPAKVVDETKFLPLEIPSTDTGLTVAAGSKVSNANFWKTQP